MGLGFRGLGFRVHMSCERVAVRLPTRVALRFTLRAAGVPNIGA